MPKCIGRSQAQFINLFEEVLPDSLKVLSKYSVNFQCPVININQLAREGLAKGARIDAVIRAMAKVRGFIRDDLPDMVRGFCRYRQRVGKGCPNDIRLYLRLQ